MHRKKVRWIILRVIFRVIGRNLIFLYFFPVKKLNKSVFWNLPKTGGPQKSAVPKTTVLGRFCELYYVLLDHKIVFFVLFPVKKLKKSVFWDLQKIGRAKLAVTCLFVQIGLTFFPVKKLNKSVFWDAGALIN